MMLSSADRGRALSARVYWRAWGCILLRGASHGQAARHVGALVELITPSPPSLTYRLAVLHLKEYRVSAVVDTLYALVLGLGRVSFWKGTLRAWSDAVAANG